MHLLLDSICISGFVIALIFSIGTSSPTSDCLASVGTCMSDLCRSEQAFYNGVCGGKYDTSLIHHFCCRALEDGAIFMFSSGIIQVIFPQEAQDM